jgi:hypothetical protein
MSTLYPNQVVSNKIDFRPSRPNKARDEYLLDFQNTQSYKNKGNNGSFPTTVNDIPLRISSEREKRYPVLK